MTHKSLFALVCTLFLVWATQIAADMGTGSSFVETESEALDLDSVLTKPRMEGSLADSLEAELDVLKRGLDRAPRTNNVMNLLNPSLASTPSQRSPQQFMSALEMGNAAAPAAAPATAAAAPSQLTPFAKMKQALQGSVNTLDTSLQAIAGSVSNIARTQSLFTDVITNDKMDIKQYELAAQELAKGPSILPSYHARTSKDVVDCTGCRFAWLKVEQDVGNSYSEKSVYDAFVAHCAGMQQSEIFFSPCNDMFAQLDDMIADYLTGHTVNQLCTNARMCR